MSDPGLKFDAEKIRLDLIDAECLEELGKVLTFGARKYEAHNWRKGIRISRLLAATLRHLMSFAKREDIDAESGLTHLSHAFCNIMFMMWTVKHNPRFDDRYQKRKR